MNFDAFRHVYGGNPLPAAEHGKYFAPDGFTLWRTKYGDVMAVREE
jgi:hypothetical protein